MSLVKIFLIHNSKTKIFPDKDFLQNASPRNLKTVSAILDLFSNIADKPDFS